MGGEVLQPIVEPVLGKPPAPPPPPPPPPEPPEPPEMPTVPDEEERRKKRKKAEEERRRLAALARGRSATVLTGALGVREPASVARKTLLGQ